MFRIALLCASLTLMGCPAGPSAPADMAKDAPRDLTTSPDASGDASPDMSVDMSGPPLDAAPDMPTPVDMTPDAHDAPADMPPEDTRTTYVLVASGRWGGAEGKVTQYAYAGGELSAPQETRVGRHAAFLAWDEVNDRVHVADETDAKIRSFGLTSGGGLTPLGEFQANSAPVHITHARSGAIALTASYGGGETESFRVDGAVRESVDRVRSGAKSHAVQVSPSGEHVFVTSLETDRIRQYELSETGDLTPNDPAFVQTPDGSGPRHMALHPSGEHLYVINETACTLMRFGLEQARGTLTAGEVVEIYPGGVPDRASGADLHVHPSGRWLIGTTRPRGAEGGLVIAALDAQGRVSPPKVFASGGETPRNMAISPDGRHLLVAHRVSEDVVAFSFDPDTGAPTKLATYDVSSPFYVGFVRYQEN